MSETQPRAALYARVSTSEQEKGYSLPTQFEALREEAEKLGARVVTEIADDHTGASLNRPGLDQLRDLAEGSEIDVILVYDLDRFARKAVHQMLLEEELQKQGVKVHYVIGRYEDTPEGRFQKQIKAAVSEYEREKILERSLRGKRGRVRQGYVLVSHTKCPYGYRYKSEPHKGYLLIHDEEARIVRLIFEHTVEGKSPRWIARFLNGDTIPSPRGGRWWHTTILKIVHNETYCGVWYYNKTAHTGKRPKPPEEWMPVEVPAIVTREIWEKAQRIIAQRLEGRPPKRYEYLLRGRVWCEGCGGRMVGSFGKGKPYYACPRNKIDYGEERCSQPTVRADVLEMMLWDYLAGLLQEPEILLEKYRQQETQSEGEIERLEGYLASIEDKIGKARQKERRFAELYAEGHITKDVFLEEKARVRVYLESLEQERVALTTEVNRHKITRQQEESFEEFCDRVKVYIEEPTFDKKQRALNRLEINVRISEKMARVFGVVPLGELGEVDPKSATTC